METSGNISDFLYALSNPAMSNSSVFCRNFSSSSGLVNANGSRCDRTAELDKSATPVIVAIIITALYSIVCVVGLVGNVLVMYVIIRYTKMKTATNIYIFNLALADALATSTLPFQSVNYLMEFAVIDCTLLFPHPSWYWENLLKICVFIFAFIMPVLIITICYGLMILRLKSVRMLSGSKEKDRNLRRITRMVLVVVAVFIVCWTPIHIFVIIKALVTIPNSLLQTVTWHFCIALGYTNSCLNPVLYAFLDENFKRCFREFCVPSPSVLDLQNSTRTRNPQRDGQSSGHTVDRTNQQV
ncbi:mu-type opioid receptor isoform X2 [Puntigrus tetrazona]|uniref:mu-type opioid receptor isoform X2 n=1 Tax=Puntigrus tetrazona TaxID=1606681 RepID=UPI001C8A468E|nr:mu-type opioid receptor isoform X2 [Puntigrus tetrazona]